MNGKTVARSLAWIVLLLLIAAPVQAAAPAQAGEVQVRLTPERNELAVGDPVQLVLEATHPAGFQVIIPALDPLWGNLEVRSQSPATTETNDDGTETTRQAIEVTLFDLGESETPPWALTISDGAGQVFEAAVPPVSLNVLPTLDAEDNELRDIKPQAGLPMPAVWPWIAGGTLLVAVLAVVGWWAYRRWRGEPFLAPAIDNRPPWQVAYDELDRIEGLGLLERHHFKEYYTLVTDCLRVYLEQQLDLRVFDRTTSELRILFRESELVPEHSRRFLELFTESDLVKFARFRPGAETAQGLLGKARELVQLTSAESLNQTATAPELEEFFQGQVPAGDRARVTPVAASQLGYPSGR